MSISFFFQQNGKTQLIRTCLCVTRLLVLCSMISLISLKVFANEISIELDAHGLTMDEQNLVLDSITLYRHRNSPLITDDYIYAYEKKGIEEISTALQSLGYYKSNIETSKDVSEGVISMKYKVEIGPPLLVKNIEINITGAGSADVTLNEWRLNLSKQAGSRLDHRNYEQAKNLLLSLLHERGYFNSKLSTHQIRIDMKTYEASIVIDVYTGPRFGFGTVYFIQHTFDTDYLSRFVPFTRGEPFQLQGLVNLQKNLTASQEFSSVKVQPMLSDAKEQNVPVQVELEPRKPTRYSLGIGYGTDTGIRVSGSVERRRLNRKGHSGKIEGLASKTKKFVAADYRMPLKNPAKDFFILRGSRTIEESVSAYSEKNAFSAQTIHQHQKWKQIANLSYEREFSIIASDSGYTRLLIPALTYEYIPQKNVTGKLLSKRFISGVKGAYEKIASDTSFFQWQGDIGLSYKLPYGMRFVTRGSAGFTVVEDINTLPASLRFFTGGDISIRGYKYNSLGPENESGEVVGGENLLVGSIEFQKQFLPKWDVAVFYDIGNAFNESSIDVKKGAGAGIGWTSPIGAIRLYGANALSDPKRPWRVHILFSGVDI